MDESIVRTALICSVAILLTVGFTAAPAAAGDGTGVSVSGDGVSIDVGDDVSIDAGEEGVDVETPEDPTVDEPSTDDVETPDGDSPSLETDDEDDGEDEPFPEEVCTDLGDQVDENAPYEELPWFDDLPQEAQPPGVPTDIVTPRAVAGILFGATPNQCDVQDPNDPSWDPREDEVDPDADAQVVKFSEREDGYFSVVTFHATLNQSGEGPGVHGVFYPGVNSEYGDSGVDLAANDGEKDYAVEPRVRYWDGGNTSYAKNDVRLLNSRLGVEVDCDGSECQPGTRGLPEFADYPAVPAPTQDDGEEQDGEFPQEVCTDLGDQVDENAPYEELPWFDDLPEEAQPPGVPTDIVTPRAVTGILFGATPNQCDVQDPNDPSWDPREDEVSPAAGAEVVKFSEREDGYFSVVTYRATLNESDDGPGVHGVFYPGVNSEYGDSGVDLAVNDGEKDYAVEPRVRYWEGGETYYAKNDVRLLNSRLGVEVDCDGSECQPGTRGLPEFADYPAIPAPTGE